MGQYRLCAHDTSSIGKLLEEDLNEVASQSVMLLSVVAIGGKGYSGEFPAAGMPTTR